MHKKRKNPQKRIRIFGRIVFCISIPLIIWTWLYILWGKIPSQIHIKQGEVGKFDFALPATAVLSKQEYSIAALDLGKPITLYAEDKDNYRMLVKLFGCINFKETEVSVIDDVKLMPVGKPIGIYVKTKGVLVIDIGEFLGEDGMKKMPAALLKKGDYICAYNQEELETKKELIDKINQSSGESVVLTIDREGEEFELKVTPEKNEAGEYKLGIWVRDNAQGVGTLTYVTQENGFGALGHGINDLDTSTLMELDYGSLYQADIISIKKGEAGLPGEITGYISYDKEEYVGKIEQNTSEGIYGSIDASFLEDMDSEYLSIGLKQEVHLGEIQILCTLDEAPAYYNAEITDIYFQNDNFSRSFRIHITDDDLLNKTGGIVQGMSGSPILQDGKIVGAVTHVLVNDPTRGYGIFIENMLEAAE